MLAVKFSDFTQKRSERIEIILRMVFVPMRNAMQVVVCSSVKMPGSSAH